MAESQIRLAADVGGTFTDLVVVGHEGRVLTRKVPSTPPDFESGVLAAVDEVLRDEAVVPGSVTAVCHGTTVATNAVLENRGAKTALITTRGFREDEFRQIGALIAEVVDGLSRNGDEGDGQVEQRVRERVEALCAKFPIYPEL